jgi:hypothetical protein
MAILCARSTMGLAPAGGDEWQRDVGTQLATTGGREDFAEVINGTLEANPFLGRVRSRRRPSYSGARLSAW